MPAQRSWSGRGPAPGSARRAAMSAKYCDATRAIGACLAELAEALGERLEWSLQRLGDGAGAAISASATLSETREAWTAAVRSRTPRVSEMCEPRAAPGSPVAYLAFWELPGARSPTGG